MALKSVLILAAIGLVYSEYSKCSAGNDKRDCTCADKAFNDCQEPVTEDQIHVADLAECKFQCDLFNSFGACDWFLYVKSGQDENCHLFGPGKESMGDYLTSCNEIAQPTRLADDTCIANPDPNDNILNGICGLTSKCPNGCKSCAGDTCNGYVETGCAMKTEGTNALDSTPEFENCQAYAIANGGAIDNVITFFKFGKRGRVQGFLQRRTRLPLPSCRMEHGHGHHHRMSN